MSYRYAIFGSGRQGTAAAYDLARFSDAQKIFMTDIDEQQASHAAERVNKLIGHEIATPKQLDVSAYGSVVTFLKDNAIDALVGATPYFHNLDLTRAAIEAGAGMTDLGGNSDVVKSQIALSPQAAEKGISIVPDCGQVPGMGTTLVLYAMEQLDEPRDVFMWDCGLPVDPEPPWNYRLTFSIEGLTNEYFGDCLFIRDGKAVEVPVLDEYETLEMPEPIGTLEAFTTAGGFSTASNTFEGKLRTLQNKTLRYPGNLAYLKVMQDLGLLDLEPIEVDGHNVVPRHVLHELWDPQIRADENTRDFIFIRILAQGIKHGHETEAQVDLLHYYDDKTGFNAMEQGTGWHAAILTGAIARGEVERGVIPIENAMSGTTFVDHAAKRGFEVKVTVREIN
jgi:lysine 6-dehydrogenase